MSENTRSLLPKSILSTFFWILLQALPIQFCQAQLPVQRLAQPQIRPKHIPSTDAIVSQDEPIDRLLARIDAAHVMLNQFDDRANAEFSTDHILRQIPRIEYSLRLVKEDLTKTHQLIDVNNLEMYAVLLSDTEEQLNTWRRSLQDFHKKLVTMNTELGAFTRTRDSVFTKMAIDSNYKTLIRTELKGLSDKFSENQEAISRSMGRVNHLQAQLSGIYYQTIELEDGVYDQKKQYWQTVTGKEAPYIWEPRIVQPKIASGSNPPSTPGSGLSVASVKGQQTILENYFAHNTNGYVLVILFALFFFVWVLVNYRQARKYQTNVKEGVLKVNYLHPIPLVATVILVLNITPFLDLDTPSMYFEMLQTVLMVFLTVLFFRRWPRKYFFYWLVILGLYLSFSLLGLDHSISRLGEWVILGLNMFSIAFGVLFFIQIRLEAFFSRFEKLVVLIFTLANGVSLILNLVSRLSLAEQVSFAAIFGLAQVIGLTAGFQILSEGLFLQAISSRNENTSGFVFEDHKIEKNLRLIFSLFIILFWSISFTDNLNIFTPIYRSVESFLGLPRHIGSTTFAYGNVISFFLILSIANFIQKFLGFFFGENYTTDNLEFKKKGSRLAITRLLLLLAGFLVAVLASGLPVDRITILIGALGVGIGLGLQNIVNNLVSGIILIFERPFQIGDLIEVGNRKGRVKDIGIRSSKLLTAEGSEVIVPNGDLLSERVVNWTFTNNSARVELDFKLASDADVVQARKLIEEYLGKNEMVYEKFPAEVYVDNYTDTTVTIKVGVWIKNINREKSFRSEVISQVYPALRAHSIAVRA